MKKSTIIGLIGVIALLGSAFYAYKAQLSENKDTNIKFEELKAYFLKNDIPLQDNTLNYFIVENQDEMDALFGTAKTMTNQVEKVAFSQDMVIALAHPATENEAKITINYVKFINNNLYIDYTFTQGAERSFAATPVKIIKFIKPANIFDIYFSQNDNIDQKIAYGRRSLSSPISLDDLKDNYTGTYKGTLPCADCEGIEQTLTLKPDMSYELKQIYLGKTKIPVKEEGIWTPSEDLALIELMDYHSYYYLNDNKTLEKADTNGAKIDSDLNYKLIKQEN